MTGDETEIGDSARLLLDRYRIEKLLGEGGLGTVVQAYDTRLKRMVAIKTLKHDQYRDDPDQFRALEERFAREAEAGSRMGSHPNIVNVHDLVLDEQRTQHLILEFVPGGTLADRIKHGVLPLSDALRLTGDIARGLRAAHEMGLVHRDIKPANVFLAADGRAQVGDFGIAQIDDISGRTRKSVGHPGTPLYMSPEQERMTAYLRPASDQYSLGLVLFEMLTGQAYKRIGEEQATRLLMEQPAAVLSLVTRMLAEQPDERYTGMDQVARAIRVIEQERANLVTQISTIAGTIPTPDADRTEVAPRYDTPRIGLHPVAPAAVLPQSVPTHARYSRRAVLIGAGGLVLAAGTAGAVMTNLRNAGSAVATATVARTAIALASVAPTAAPTIALSVAGTSPPTVTAVPATPIIITATPVVITATPVPTLSPTVPLPVTATATPSSRLPVVTAPEIGLSASVLEQPKQIDMETDGTIVTKFFVFSRSSLGLHLFRNETGGDTPEGWLRVQRHILNVSTTSKPAPAAATDGRKGYTGDVAGICDEAETKCLSCSFGPQGVVCPTNTGLVRPIHWYHVILSAQASGGIIVADYFCNLADKSSHDCYNDALTILPSMRVIGSPAGR